MKIELNEEAVYVALIAGGVVIVIVAILAETLAKVWK